LSEIFSGNGHKLGLWLSKAAVFAGMLDILENCGMLVTLGGTHSNLVAAVTAVCALIKWLFVLLAILYVLFTSPFALYLSVKNKR
jgi:hypothetical protein